MTTKAKPTRKPKAKRRAKTKPAPEYVLVLRTCSRDMGSHGGFVWPTSGPVECNDWNEEPVCGGGLHGLLWGRGDYSLMNDDPQAKWLVVKVASKDVVEIDSSKCKFPRGEVVYCGSMAEAMARVICDPQAMLDADEIASGYGSRGASSGDYSQAASSGDYSRAASSGYGSRAASSGNGSQAASIGYGSRAASSGDYSQAASSDDYSQAASSGDYSQAASSGDYSRAASSGDYSRAASSGNGSIAAVAGTNGTASAGTNGCFALAYFDGNRYRFAVGIVGENGIEADTLYRVKNDRGELEPA